MRDGAQLGCWDAFSVFHRSTVSDTEKGDEGRSERGWTKCEGSGVFRLVKRCVCTFFFFFFLYFGLTRPFWPIQADTDRVGLILAASAPISAESTPTSAASARFGPCHVARRGPTWHGRAVCGVPAASPRPATSDAGAPALGPRPCIPAYICKLSMFLYGIFFSSLKIVIVGSLCYFKDRKSVV